MDATSGSTFSSFSTTYTSAIPAGTNSTANNPLALKQRRVSCALPNSPKLANAWSFRDDTSIDKHAASSSSLTDKKGKMRRSSVMEEPRPSERAPMFVPEKRVRKKWTEEETQMLVTGCNTWGVGNWKAILNDPSLKFDNRSPVDLKDRFRTFFPDAYKLHYPNAKTHLSSKIRSTLPDGTSLFEKTRSKKRRPFTTEEDRALKAGYEKYGTVWSTIVKDPIFQEQGRRSTDLRDRFRNAFPDLYQAAGYKPRSLPKKKRGDVNVSAPRQAADDQLLSTRMSSSASRRRSRTTSGYSYSVPQSAACSEDEDSSDEDDIMEVNKSSLGYGVTKEMTPQPDCSQFPPIETLLDEATLHTIEQNDPLADMSLPDFFPEPPQTASDSAEQSNWSSSDRQSPPQAESWSSAATNTTTSPTSSQVSIGDYFFNSTLDAFDRRDGSNMIGKSPWDPTDWLSGNPRLDPNNTSSMSSGSSFVGGPSPPPSSPYSFSQLSHGIMDRLDLFENSFAHDFASEVGASDAYSTFSDPELFPSQSMRGFTHSNYAGDLIFGARTHQPVMPMAAALNGLGLSGIPQDTDGINPLHLHTPNLTDIDEFAAIHLDDADEPMLPASPAAPVNTHTEKTERHGSLAYGVDLSSLVHLPPQTLEEIAGLTSASLNMDQESAETPPATPGRMGRVARELYSSPYASSSLHHRSMSVPPFERVIERPPVPQGHATPQPGPTRSLSNFTVPTLPSDLNTVIPAMPMSSNSAQPNFTLPASFFNTSFDSFKSIDLSDLGFLDLQAPIPDLTHHDIIDVGTAGTADTRNGLALDLAQTHNNAATAGMTATSTAVPMHSLPAPTVESSFSSGGRGASTGTVRGTSPFVAMQQQHDHNGRPQHHRVQSQLVVAPKDLLLSYDSRHKRMSWDGGAV